MQAPRCHKASWGGQSPVHYCFDLGLLTAGGGHGGVVDGVWEVAVEVSAIPVQGSTNGVFKGQCSNDLRPLEI
jgi:hypothetical protein